uniref:Uncharacterized protein n=1 Tax=Anopheles atroparvus TaxID=41427 RepID=A0A182IMY7_ANOAO
MHYFDRFQDICQEEGKNKTMEFFSKCHLDVAQNKGELEVDICQEEGKNKTMEFFSKCHLDVAQNKGELEVVVPPEANRR